MKKEEIDELKRKFNLKSKAKKINISTPANFEEALKIIVDTLYDEYKKGENVYAEMFLNIPQGLAKYKIYSCDFEGMTKEQFLGETLVRHSETERAENVILKNGSYKLPETMLEDFNNGEDTVYLYNGHNGISAIFDRYTFDLRTDEDFLDYTNILMTGETMEEMRQSEEKTTENMQLHKEQRIEEIKKQMPQWIEQGNSMIYLEKQEEWKNYVESFQGDGIILASIVGQALEIMKSLEENGSLINAKEILIEQGHSGASRNEVMNLVFEFSKKGPEFYEYVQPEIDEENAKRILEQKAKNKEYAANAEKRKVDNELTMEGQTAEIRKQEISAEKIGKATINTSTELKKAVEQVEIDEKTKDNIKEGEEVGDDN